VVGGSDSREGICAFDTETTWLDPHTAELVGIALALPSGEACYVPVGHQGAEQLPLTTVLNVLGPVLSMALVTKVMQNAKYDLHVMARYGIEVACVEDTMLKSYSMFGGKHRHNMDDLARMYLNHDTIKFSQVTGTGANKVSFDYVELEPATEYAAEDAEVTLRLDRRMNELLATDRQSSDRYNFIERPLLTVVTKMEQRGILVDLDHLKRLETEFSEQAARAANRCWEIVGEPFNAASPQQVATVLERLGVELVEKTESGKPATGVKVLEDIRENSQITPAAKETST